MYGIKLQNDRKLVFTMCYIMLQMDRIEYFLITITTNNAKNN